MPQDNLTAIPGTQPGSPADLFPDVCKAAGELSQAIANRERQGRDAGNTANLRGVLARALRAPPKGRPLDPITARQLQGWTDRAFYER